MKLVLLVVGSVACECYNDNEFYTGTETGPNCEPWAESEWAWPNMFSMFNRDSNYCR